MIRIPTFAELAALVTRPAAPIVDQEIAASQDGQFARFDTLQYSPDDLITKKQFGAYEKMMNDDQVNLCISGVKLIRLSSGYEVEEASEDPIDQEIADFVGDVIESMADTSTHNLLFNVMGGLEIGWSLQEIIWEFIEKGPWQGRLGIKAIKSKNPKWFNVQVDDFSNPLSIVSLSYPEYAKKYPIEKFLLYSFQKRYENVFGTGRLRSLYNWWWVKQVMIRAMGVYMEKFGLPLPVGKYPKHFSKEQQADFLAALTKLRIEHAIILPDGTTVDFVEATGKGSEAFLNIIEKADAQIAKVIMGQTLTSGVGKGQGSSGGGEGGLGTLGKVQFDILTMYLEYLGNDLSTGPMNQLIRRIVDYNYSGVYKYPTFKFKSLTPEDIKPRVTSFLECVKAMVIKATPEDENQLRKMLNFNNNSSQQTKLRPNRKINVVKLDVAKPAPETGTIPQTQSAFAEKLFGRKFTQYEEKVDFQGVVEVQDEAIKKILPEAAAICNDMVAKLINDIKREKIVEENNIPAINKLEVRSKGELNRVFAAGLERVAIQSVREAKREVRSVGRLAETDWMTPTEVLTFLKQKPFWITSVISQNILDSVKLELYNGIKMGKSYGDIVFAIQTALETYTGSKETAQDLSAARLETVVRTNVAEAYNQSRDAIFTSKDMDGFVVAFQYSAILDDRTRPSHAAMDGRIYLINDPIWKLWTPPNGFNCRCMKIPVTKYEKFTVSEPPPASVQPDAGFK